MERVTSLFEIIIFTASQSIYAEQLLNVLDPGGKVFWHRVFRESCVHVEGNHLKDLSVLGRDLARVIIVDYSPQDILLLIPFLEILAGVEAIGTLIAQKFNLGKRIAAAVSTSRIAAVVYPS
ncbi:CTD small phosphatase-like protein [Drosera capensis]